MLNFYAFTNLSKSQLYKIKIPKRNFGIHMFEIQYYLFAISI